MSEGVTAGDWGRGALVGTHLLESPLGDGRMGDGLLGGGLFVDSLPVWFFYLAAAVLGLSLGSFLNVVIYRLPRGLSLSHPPSHCPHCEAPIAVYHNVPLFGWLWLRGKSRCCRAPISPRYPLVELLGGLLACCIVLTKIEPYYHEWTLGRAGVIFSLNLCFVLGLLAAAFIDWEHMIIPDSITWGGTVLGLLTATLRPEVDLLGAALGAFAGFVGIWLPFIWLHEKLRGFPGMGLGDAKLMALAGAWLGPWGAVLTLFAGAVQGTLFTVSALLATGKLEEPRAVALQREELLAAIEQAEGDERAQLEQELAADPLGLAPDEAPGGPRVAFGPFLALAMIEIHLFHEPLMRWLRNYLLL